MCIIRRQMTFSEVTLSHMKEIWVFLFRFYSKPRYIYIIPDTVGRVNMQLYIVQTYVI